MNISQHQLHALHNYLQSIIFRSLKSILITY